MSDQVLATHVESGLRADELGKVMFEKVGRGDTAASKTLVEVRKSVAPLDIIGGVASTSKEVRKVTVDSLFGGKEPDGSTAEDAELKRLYDGLSKKLETIAEGIQGANIDFKSAGAREVGLQLEQVIVNTPGLREQYLDAIGGERNLGRADNFSILDRVFGQNETLKKLMKHGGLQAEARAKLMEALIIQEQIVPYKELKQIHDRLVARREEAIKRQEKLTRSGIFRSTALSQAEYTNRVAAGRAELANIVRDIAIIQTTNDGLRTNINTWQNMIDSYPVPPVGAPAVMPATSQAQLRENIKRAENDIKANDKLIDKKRKIQEDRQKEVDDLIKKQQETVALDQVDKEVDQLTGQIETVRKDMLQAYQTIVARATEFDKKLSAILPEAAVSLLKRLEGSIDDAHRRVEQTEAQNKISEAEKEGDILKAAEGYMNDALSRRYVISEKKGRRIRYKTDTKLLQKDFARLMDAGSTTFSQELLGKDTKGGLFDFLRRQPKETIKEGHIMPDTIEAYLRDHPDAHKKLVAQMKGKIFNEVTRSAVANLNLDDRSVRALCASDDFMLSAQSAAERAPEVNALLTQLKVNRLTPHTFKEKIAGTPVGSLLWLIMMVCSLGTKDIFRNVDAAT